VPYGHLPADTYPETDMGERYLFGFESMIKHELAASSSGKQVLVLVSHEGALKHLMMKYLNMEKKPHPVYCATLEFKAVTDPEAGFRIVSAQILKY
jgi:broad specificity phosphatase PhoE